MVELRQAEDKHAAGISSHTIELYLPDSFIQPRLLLPFAQ